MENKFPEIKKRFGFGCMRMKTVDGKIDYEEFSKMIDVFLENGFNYFDTARIYFEGQSEIALRECLTSRYPRDAYVLTDKLSFKYFNCKEDVEKCLDAQLADCGVEYFDFYLMHAQNAKYYEHYKACHAYEEAFRLKQAGKIRHVGISFHDTAEVLDMILTENPGIEVVQLQFNYVDYEDERIQSKLCYDVCVKHGKPVLVMEPVKGGQLVNMSSQMGEIIDALQGGSRASYALRFVAEHPNVIMILSGMGNMEMMMDNISTMKEPKPLTDDERNALKKAAAVYWGTEQIPCTGCRYCVDGCPQQIPIPDIFAAVNESKITGVPADLNSLPGGKASDCVHCRKCERTCPQHLPIRPLLQRSVNEKV